MKLPKKLFNIKSMLVALALVLPAIVFAQTGSMDSGAVHLSQKLGISREQAKQIQNAYGSYREDIDRLMKDPNLKPQERQRELRRYRAMRQQMIDSLVTPEQRAKLQPDDRAYRQQEAERRKRVEQRQQERLNQVPHKAVQKPALRDTTKKQGKLNRSI